MMSPTGFRLLPGRLDESAQAALVTEVLAAAERAPFYRPVTPGGKPMSVIRPKLGLTFDDVLLVPRHSTIHPSEVSTVTRLTPAR